MIGPLALACLWELAWWKRRWIARRDIYAQARAHARRVGKPLLVIGAPDGGPTDSPGADADLIVDINPSRFPQAIRCDITKGIPVPNDSVVVYVSCVLEYVDDLDRALRELKRVGGDRVYVVRVEPWSLVAYLYPNAQHVLDMRQFANGKG